MNKPPYRVPSMAEIRATPLNGYTVASTFSGAGGSSLGYRMAGFRVAWCSEFVPAARDTYAANAPDTVIDARDIRDVSVTDVLGALGMRSGELDVLDGSPPCASFSTAGKRATGWGNVKTYSDTAQRSDDLFFEYARLLRGLQPRVFVAENVSGLVKGVAKGYFKEILAELKGCGYRVAARLLDAQWLGVPQARQRIIFIGVRDDLALEPVHPDPLPYRYSLRDALPGLSAGRVIHDTSGTRGAGDVTDRPSPTITCGVKVINSQHYQVVHDMGGSFHSAGNVTDSPCPTITSGSTGGNASSFQVVHDTGGRFHCAGNVTDEPCPTITSGSAGGDAGHYQIVAVSANPGFGTEEWQSPDRPVKTIGTGIHSGNGRCGAGEVLTHRAQGISYDPETGARITIGGERNKHNPVERRKFTLRELRRVCGFPDDFVLTGTYAQRWERLGRAVPPPMMAAIATVIRDEILRKADG